MDLRRELWIAIGALVTINVLLAFGATGLLVRMGPAIERILDENVASIDAAEEMLAVLASAGSEPLSPDERSRLDAALGRARARAVRPEVGSLLGAMEAQVPRAVEGMRESRRTLVLLLEQWIEGNRATMRDVDREAKRLSLAGAWAAVGTGILSLAMSLIVVTYLRRRIAVPIEELDRVLEDVRRGEAHRRCRLHEARGELLDARESEDARPARVTADHARHMGLVALLDRLPGSALVLDAAGEIAAANARALETLAGGDGRVLRTNLSAMATSSAAPPEGAQAVELRDHAGWLVVLEGAAPGSLA
jgi:hypothetical protein